MANLESKGPDGQFYSCINNNIGYTRWVETRLYALVKNKQCPPQSSLVYALVSLLFSRSKSKNASHAQSLSQSAKS